MTRSSPGPGRWGTSRRPLAESMRRIDLAELRRNEPSLTARHVLKVGCVRDNGERHPTQISPCHRRSCLWASGRLRTPRSRAQWLLTHALRRTRGAAIEIIRVLHQHGVELVGDGRRYGCGIIIGGMDPIAGGEGISTIVRIGVPSWRVNVYKSRTVNVDSLKPVNVDV